MKVNRARILIFSDHRGMPGPFLRVRGTTAEIQLWVGTTDALFKNRSGLDQHYLGRLLGVGESYPISEVQLVMKNRYLSRCESLWISALAGCSALLNAKVAAGQNPSAADEF